MKPQLSGRDYELITAYLDDALKRKERLDLEARLQKDSAFKAAFQDMERTRLLLRSLPTMRAPRNFTLSPSMLGKSVLPTGVYPRFYNTLKLSAVLSSFLLIFVLLGDLLSNTLSPGMVAKAPAPAPAQMEQMALPVASEEMVEALKELSPAEVGGIAATSAPLATVPADLLVTEFQATQAIPTMTAQDLPMAAEAGQTAQYAESPPQTAALPAAPADTPAALLIEADTATAAAIASSPDNNIATPQPEPEQIVQSGEGVEDVSTPRPIQVTDRRFIFCIIEIFLIVVTLLTGLSTWVLYRKINR